MLVEYLDKYRYVLQITTNKFAFLTTATATVRNARQGLSSHDDRFDFLAGERKELL